MKTLIIFVGILTLLITKASAQTVAKHGCDCALGWPKECDAECGPKLLSAMSDAELRDKFKLSDKSIYMVHELRKKNNATLEMYKTQLGVIEYGKVKDGVKKVRDNLNNTFTK